MRISQLLDEFKRFFRSIVPWGSADTSTPMSADGPLEIQVSERPDGKLVRPEGVVDFRTSPLLRKVLQRWVRKRVTGVVVSLKDVEHLDTSGVATLIEAFEKMKGYGGRLLLTDVGPQARQMLSLAGSGRLRGATPILRTSPARKRAS
jgi:anti-anti-sigma factor